MKHLEILPSILSFDFKNINTELKRMKDNGITYLHYDVMDGHFVSNISFGESLYKQLVPEGFKANVHLMVTNPLPHAIKFYEMGADSVLVHYEAIENIASFAEDIKPFKKDKQIGIVINPETDVKEVLPHLYLFDIVMVMTVHPGASGQAFLKEGLNKIKILRDFIDNNKLNTLIEVDGGINGITGPLAVENGVDMLVSGSYLCKSEDLIKAKESILGIKDINN